jgi:hypothetical protein
VIHHKPSAHRKEERALILIDQEIFHANCC